MGTADLNKGKHFDILELDQETFDNLKFDQNTIDI